MCFICDEKRLHRAGWDRYGEPSQCKGGIEYQKVRRAMRVVEDCEDKWDDDFDFDVWLQRYGPRMARALEAGSNSKDGKPPKEAEHGYAEGSLEWKCICKCVN